MFKALTNSLVVLFIAVLLQIFRQNFYSNASCFSLLWLYLGNSHVSISCIVHAFTKLYQSYPTCTIYKSGW